MYKNRTKGFTLIELIIVIGIIGLLVSLAFSAGSNVQEIAKEQSTKKSLLSLLMANDQFKAETGKVVNHSGVDDNPHRTHLSMRINWDVSNRFFNVPRVIGDAAPITSNTVTDYRNNSIEQFLSVIYASATARKALGKTDEEHLCDKNKNGYYEMRDGWGKKIVYATFAVHDAQATYDSEVPNRILIPNLYKHDDFLPSYAKPFFASAGPDGEWGDAHADETSSDYKQAQDNIYSYELD